MSALGRIAPQWYLRGSLGVMSAKIREDHSKPQASGRHLNNTSNIQGNLFVRYMPNEKLYGEVGFTGTGKRYYYNRNDEYQPVPGFVRTDALVGYNHKNWNFTLAAYNLFNHQYWRANDMPGSPRAFTARVNYSF
nr:TonB-dependent receptor [Neisseria sp. 83E34]